MQLQLRDQLAIIFGAASGIGRAIAEAFSGEEARCVLIDRDPQVISVGESLAGSTARVIDVTDYAAIEALAADLAHQQAAMHVVFAAGIGSGKVGMPFWNLSARDWPRVLEVNLQGAVNVAHAFGPKLAEQQQGTMLMLSSVAGQIGSPTDPPYSASKAALINFAQVAAKDLAPYSVRVNVISPGMVETPLNHAIWEAWNQAQPPGQQRVFEAWAEEKIHRIAPLGRWQTAEEIAALAVFLASDYARNITGQTLNVDGGQVMHS
jgi:NAD(P)-dependent dehydrogenase (short-subunit alcohol dehydrogenase family)